MANTSDAYRSMFQWLTCQITGRTFFSRLCTSISTYIRLHFCSIFFFMCCFLFPVGIAIFWMESYRRMWKRLSIQQFGTRLCLWTRQKNHHFGNDYFVWPKKENISINYIHANQVEQSHFIYTLLCYVMLCYMYV